MKRSKSKAVVVDFVLPTIPQSWDCDGQGNCFDPGTGNGLYSSLSSCQSSCVISSEIQEHKTEKTILSIIDLLGRNIKEINNTILIYLYDDGSVEKKIIIK